MLYVRGNKYDYDQWEKNGAEGWNYEQVLPYFIKSEANKSPRFKDSRKYYDNTSAQNASFCQGNKLY